MIALLFSCILSSFIFIVFGIFISKILKFPTDFTGTIFIGLAVSNTITTILSLFFPINIYILLVFLLCSTCLLFFIKKEITTFIRSLKNKKNIILYSLPFVLLAFIISLGASQYYDTGLYQIQSVKWIEKYAVVPGLANLHGRFGFNNNIFTIFALTSLFDLFKQEIFSINFILFSVFVIYFINRLYVILKNHGITNLFIFNLIVFVTILNLSYFHNLLSSPSPEFISITFPMFILTRVFNPIHQGKGSLQSYISVFILCAYSLTVKLATLPVFILAICIIIVHYSEIRKLLWICLLLSVIILPWVVRNIILTGWIVYPFSSLDLFTFDWKVPILNVISEKESITGWARIPGEQYVAAAHMNIFEWFTTWWHSIHKITYKILFLTSLFLPLVAFIGHLIKKIKLDFQTFAIIFTAFIGVLFWFMLAPNFRFGKAFIIIASLSPLLYFRFKIKLYRKTDPIFILSILLFILFIDIAKNNRSIIKKVVSDTSNNIMKPQIFIGKQEFITYNISGIKIYVPTKDDRCFDHCIPCTPYPDTTIILRNYSLQSGFKHKENINSQIHPIIRTWGKGNF